MPNHISLKKNNIYSITDFQPQRGKVMSEYDRIKVGHPYMIYYYICSPVDEDDEYVLDKCSVIMEDDKLMISRIQDDGDFELQTIFTTDGNYMATTKRRYYKKYCFKLPPVNHNDITISLLQNDDRFKKLSMICHVVDYEYKTVDNNFVYSQLIKDNDKLYLITKSTMIDIQCSEYDHAYIHKDHVITLKLNNASVLISKYYRQTGSSVESFNVPWTKSDIYFMIVYDSCLYIVYEKGNNMIINLETKETMPFSRISENDDHCYNFKCNSKGLLYMMSEEHVYCMQLPSWQQIKVDANDITLDDGETMDYGNVNAFILGDIEDDHSHLVVQVDNKFMLTKMT